MRILRLSFVISVALACVVTSTAYSSNLLLLIAPLLGNKNNSSYGDMNTVTKLISVSSGSSDSLTADWLPSQDDQTPASQIRYTLHVSTDEDFLPSAATAKGTVVGKETLTVTGLQPDTQYFVLVAAADGSGNQSWSNRLQARTVATAAVRTSAVVEEQTESQNPTVTASTVSYTSDKLPAAGEYLISSVGDGYLRKVVSATSANGVVTAQTEDASLNEVLEQYELSTTVKIAALPAASSSSAPSMVQAADGSQIPARQHHWEKSGLTLKDSNQTTANNRIVSTASGKLVAASSYIPLQIKNGEHSYMTGPKYLASSPGTTLNSTINVQVASKKDEQICKIVLSEFTHDDSTLSKLPPPTSNKTIAADKKSGSLQLHFSPTNSYLDSKNRPYEAKVIAYVNKKSQGCNGVRFWDDKLEMKIPVYLERGRLEVEDEEKTVTFSGDFSVTNDVEMTFEPELNIDVQASTFSLKSADFIAKANIGLSNTLTITASAEGNLSKTVPLVSKREFIKIFTVGGVPVVVRGAFSMNARIDGHIGGKATLTKFMELSFPDTTFGVQYRNGSWQTVKNFTPKYTFSIDGEANADANISLTLIPDLQIHFYEAASGRMILEPALYAETWLHGQFKYQDADGNKLTDLDYWFSYLNAGVSLDMRLYAGLHVLDYNIVSWPEDVSYTETDKFNHFQPITRLQGRMYSLPTLKATADYEPDSPPDSRAILISSTATDFITPLFGWNLNPFQKWTEAKVITDLADSSYTITPLNENLAQHWFVPKQAGDFTVRLGGHSKLGWFVRQITGVPLSLPDADADGLPDYWESRFGITDAGGDNDSDGLSNAAEFSHGTQPNTADSDGGGTSDGQEIADGTNPLDGSDDISHDIAVLTVSEGSVTEGNSGSKQLEFTLNLDQFYGTASVDYTTKDGTATTAGNDYVADSGTVSFVGGSTSEKVSITVNGDTDVEPDETFSLQLSNPVNLTLASSSATGTIVNDDSSTTGTVVSATGRVWMDRNLGASRVATSMDDEQAYGDLYQWGRLTDGHEKRDSDTTTTLSSTDVPGHDKFILAPDAPNNWRNPSNNNLWQGVDGTNNPCPNGFRLPTDDEWSSEIDSWSSQDASGAFASPLKLTMAGNRAYSTGAIASLGSTGYYWSSQSISHPQGVYFNSSSGLGLATYYGIGFSVRCILDEEPLQCGGPQEEAGGDTPEIHSYNMGTNSGSFQFDYETNSAKDRIIIKHDNLQIFDTGCVGESRTVTINFSGSSSVISVEVIPNCAGSTGTNWTYTVHCPN